MEKFELIMIISLAFYMLRFLYCYIVTEKVIKKITKARFKYLDADFTYAVLEWETKVLESSIMLHRWNMRSITQFKDDDEWELIKKC